MNRKLATKSDLSNIITSGGGTFSSSSNEILTSSYTNGLSSSSIGGTLTLTYSVESTGRSSYLSNECVLYEDIHFEKVTSESGYVFVVGPYYITEETSNIDPKGIKITSYKTDSNMGTIDVSWSCDNISDVPNWCELNYSTSDTWYFTETEINTTGAERQFTLNFTLDESGKKDSITIKLTPVEPPTPTEPLYTVHISPWDFTITTDEWTYFTVESYKEDADGTKTKISGDFTDVPDWVTLESYTLNDSEFEYGYRVKGASEVTETKTVDLYFTLDESEKTDYIRLTQYKPNAVTYTITYKASTGVSGSDVTETVEENTTYTPTAPSSFTLQSGYQEPIICTPSEEFTVTENKEILVSATETPKPKEYEFAFYRGYDVGEDDNTDWYGYIGEEYIIYINHTVDDYEHEIKICSKEILDNNWSFVQYAHNDLPSWISISDGDGGISIKTAENNTNIERSFDVIFTLDESGKTITLHVIQIAYDGTLLYDFDHLILKYNWTDSNGTDLDNATYLGYIKTDGTEVLYNPVGYGQKKTDNITNTYLFYGGDNTTSGDEGAYINFKDFVENIIKPLNAENRNIKSVVCKTRSNWFEQKGDGKYKLTYTTYKGGTISKDGFTFTNNGGTLVSTVENVELSCYAIGQKNYKDANQWYTKMSTIIYNFNTNSAYISYDQTDENGNEDYGFIYDTFEVQSFSKTINSVTTEYKDEIRTNIYSGLPTFSLSSQFLIEKDSTVYTEIKISGNINGTTVYLNNSDIISKSNLSDWDTVESTENGYRASRIIEDSSSDNSFYNYVNVGPILSNHQYYILNEDLSELSFNGDEDDEDYSIYLTYSSLLIDTNNKGPIYIGNKDGYTIKGKIISVDAAGNKSTISTSNVSDGLEITYSDSTESNYQYNMNIVVSGNNNVEQITKSFVLNNEAGNLITYYITQSGTSYYVISDNQMDESNTERALLKNNSYVYGIDIDSLSTGNVKNFYITSFGGDVYLEEDSEHTNTNDNAITLTKDNDCFTINIDSVNDSSSDRKHYYNIYLKDDSENHINARSIVITQRKK